MTESVSTNKTANKLINETSPYLLQHAHNPVNWYPWCTEALEKSRQEDKPILLSIGYSACHWCHVMEHESFEDESTAALMNKDFVPIKVDREERPDLDEIYMKAVQMMTGHGGWPMTVFLTKDLKPFFGGTYFPPEDRHGIPSFKRVLASIASAWQSNREEVESSSQELTKYLQDFDNIPKSKSKLAKQSIEEALEQMLAVFDREWGGFGNAPKFPFPCSLTLVLRSLASNASISNEQRENYLQLLSTTLNKMSLGGIYDQIGGGFARYSVDRRWLIPHFEKMLYDNATLSKVYFESYLLTGRKYWRQIGEECLNFVERELRSDEGAFYSSLDADSEGEEGKFYAWTPAEIISILGNADGNWFCEIYGVTTNGNFEHETSVLNLVELPAALSKRYDMTEDDFWQKLAPLRTKLLSVREKRIHPGRDEKILTSWNSLMISGFVAGYKATANHRYLETAKNAAQFLLSKLCVNDRLLRTYGQGKARLNAYLDDYAFLIQALLDLSEVDFSSQWYNKAIALAESMLQHFWDNEQAGFNYTSDDHEVLIARPRNFYDGSTPSGTSVATTTLLRLSRLTGNQTYEKKAVEVLEMFYPHFKKAPDQFANLLCALDFHLSNPIEIAMIADTEKQGWQPLLNKINSVYLPNSVILLKSDSDEVRSPLFDGRTLLEGKPTIYICHNFTCDKPVTDIRDLEISLKHLAAKSKN